jgi:hypothetical protein
MGVPAAEVFRRYSATAEAGKKVRSFLKKRTKKLSPFAPRSTIHPRCKWKKVFLLLFLQKKKTLA